MKTIFTIASFFFFLSVIAQNASINWQKTIGGSDQDIAHEIIAAPDDSGYYVVGYSMSDTSGEKSQNSRGLSDVWLVKLDQQGQFLWDKTIGGNEHEYYEFGFDLVADQNRLYILSKSHSTPSGDKESPQYGDGDLWLICMDFDGNLIWQESYGGSGNESTGSMILMENGNLFVFGDSYSGISGNKTSPRIGMKDYWILEINSDDGSIVNQKSIGSELEDYAMSAVADEEGNYYLLGSSPEGISGDKTEQGFSYQDIWLVKLDSEFNVVQNRVFGGTENEGLFGRVAYSEGSLYFTCSSSSPISGNKTATHWGERDYWIVKLDTDLNMIWDKTFGAGFVDLPTSIVPLSDNRILVGGFSVTYTSGNQNVTSHGTRDIWTVLIDEDGNEIAQMSYGGFNPEKCGDIKYLNESLIVAGSSAASNSGNKTEESRGGYDFWILDLNISPFLSVVDHMKSELEVSTFPNPFTHQITFDLSAINNPSRLCIFTADGKLVHCENVIGQNRFTWQPKNASGSLYFYELVSDAGIFRGKLMR